MVNPKFVDGKIKYLLKTFDGSYVSSEMYEDEAKVFLSGAEQNGDVPGFELVKEPYRFETEQIVLKLNKSKKKQEE